MMEINLQYGVVLWFLLFSGLLFGFWIGEKIANSHKWLEIVQIISDKITAYRIRKLYEYRNKHN